MLFAISYWVSIPLFLLVMTDSKHGELPALNLAIGDTLFTFEALTIWFLVSVYCSIMGRTYWKKRSDITFKGYYGFHTIFTLSLLYLLFGSMIDGALYLKYYQSDLNFFYIHNFHPSTKLFLIGSFFFLIFQIFFWVYFRSSFSKKIKPSFDILDEPIT